MSISRTASCRVDMYPNDTRTDPVGRPSTNETSSQQACPAASFSLILRAGGKGKERGSKGGKGGGKEEERYVQNQ